MAANFVLTEESLLEFDNIIELNQQLMRMKFCKDEISVVIGLWRNMRSIVQISSMATTWILLLLNRLAEARKK